MMLTEILDVRTYKFKREDRVLLDANIWIYIHGPDARGWKTEVYSAALKRIRLAQSAIHVDLLVLSEFMNRYARIHQGYSRKKEFKEFRGSPEYGIVAKSIAAAARRIIKLCHLVTDGFEAVDIGKLIDTFELECADFNDLVIAETCRSENLMLVTHDGDFRESGITILTASPALLRP